MSGPPAGQDGEDVVALRQKGVVGLADQRQIARAANAFLRTMGDGIDRLLFQPSRLHLDKRGKIAVARDVDFAELGAMADGKNAVAFSEQGKFCEMFRDMAAASGIAALLALAVVTHAAPSSQGDVDRGRASTSPSDARPQPKPWRSAWSSTGP